jgi:H+/gluconate symporter-like permease
MTYLKHSLLLDLGWFGLISGIIIKILVSIWHLQIKSNQDTASSAELKSEEENDEYLLHQNNQIMRIYAYIFICVVLLKTFRPFLSQSELSQFQNVSWYLQLIGCLVILFVAIRVVIEYQEGLKAEENKEEQ